MAGALILITAKVGTMKEVLDKIKDLDSITEARMLTGPYDIMAIAEADEMPKITNILVDKIRKLENVEDTVTNVYIE